MQQFTFRRARQFLTRGPLALVLAVALALAQTGSASDVAVSDWFVNASWLQQNLTRVLVVDARSPGLFPKRRIPGAVSAPWQDFTRLDGRPGDPGWGELLPPDQLAANLGRLGIDGRMPIVVYAETPGWGEDGRFAWMAQGIGLNQVSILDGGISAWIAAGGATTWAAPSAPQRTLAVATRDESLTATTDWILQHLDGVKIVDSRTPEEFKGARKYGEARGGHLPGAISIPLETLFHQDGTIKTPTELERLFLDAGLEPKDEIVAYCTAGIRSAHLTLMLRRAGFSKARNYDASFYEWAARTDLPLE